MPSKITQPHPLHDIISGGCAGMASVLVGHPFDTIKVRLQTDKTFSSVFAVVRRLEGPSALFKGMGAPMYSSVGVNALIFSSYSWAIHTFESYENSPSMQRIKAGLEPAKVQVSKETPASTSSRSSLGMNRGVLSISDERRRVKMEKRFELYKHFICGMWAGFVQCLIICPTEHIKCRLQIQHLPGSTPLRGPGHAFQTIFKSHGLRGVYRGWWVSCLREVPSFGVYFASYDLIREKLSGERSWSRAASSIIAGGLSGSLTWLCVYPVDMIKTKIQTMPLATTQKERRMVTVLRNIVSEGGVSSLFRGLNITILRAFPVNAMIFPVYEICIYLCQTPSVEWKVEDVFGSSTT